MQEISLPPKYVKQISSFLSLCSFALGKAGTEMLKRIELAFIFSVVVLINVNPDSIIIITIISLLLLLLSSSTSFFY